MKLLLRALPMALMVLLVVFACKKNDDDDAEDLCTVSDEIPESIPGWSSKRMITGYTFGNPFVQFRFLDAQIGYAIGATLIRTTDGGTNWMDVASFPRPAFSNLRLFDVVNDSTFFVVSDTFPNGQDPSVQAFQRTSDGIHWQTVVVSDWILACIRFTDSLNGFAWGYDAIAPFNPQFLKTTDGGNTWTPVSGLTIPAIHSQFSIEWRNADVGLAHTGYDVAYATDDGGQTWYDVSTPTDKPLVYYRSNASTFFGRDENYLSQFSINKGQDWTNTDPSKVVVLTIDGSDGFGVVTQTACTNQQQGDVALATSTDTGRTWQRTRLVSNFQFYNAQEVAPGLWVTYRSQEGVFYWFEKN